MAGDSWSWSAVFARRLQRHGLSVPLAGAQPGDVATAICGVHAQVLSAAELSVALRLRGATRADVRDALWADHSLIKTVGPRGTLHLLATRDLAMWTGALSAVPTSDNGYPEDVRFAPEQTEQIIAAMTDVLADAALTAEELTEALVAATGPWARDPQVEGFQQRWPRWRLALYPAARRGAICYGPNRGRTVTYTSPRRWFPELRPAEPRAALADLVRRYLFAYGPATFAHVAQWLAAPRPWTRDLFESLDGALEHVDVDGTAAWVAAGDTDLPSTFPRGVRLLPYFDAYTVGSHPRERVFPGRAAERALAGGQAGNFPVLLVDGVVAGVWHQRRSGRKVDITVEPLHDLTAAQRRGLDEQVERVGEILEATPRLTIGTVAVGPHA